MKKTMMFLLFAIASTSLTAHGDNIWPSTTQNILPGGTVSVGCNLSNYPSGSTCSLVCGNGSGASNGVCKYTAAGTYTFQGTIFYGSQTHRHTASIVVQNVDPVPSAGYVFGVGTDQRVYWRTSLSSDAGWGLMQNSAAVADITVLKDKRIIGVGVDNQLYYRENLQWKVAAASCCVKSITQLSNGTIVGVGTDYGLWSKTSLNATWNSVPNSKSVTKAVALANDAIVGVGTDNTLWLRSTLTSSWTRVPNSGNVIDVLVTKLGEVYGVGTNYALYKRSSNNLSDPSGVWVGQTSACCVRSIYEDAYGTIFGIGTDQQLWKRVNGAWSVISNSGYVTRAFAVK